MGPADDSGGARAVAAPAAGGPVSLAIVDRDSGFVTVLAKRAAALGWEQRTLAHPPSVEALVRMRVNALVIDLSLLGAAARAYMQELRAGLPALGVVVCTGPTSVGQRVRGLRLGADDWITKPCHPEEVVARLEAVVRRGARSTVAAPAAALASGPLSIRPDLFQAFAGDVSVELTRREFELLHLLAGAEGIVLERDEIYQRVWGYGMAHGDRSVDVFVRKLRRKLELASPGWRYIHTHFGVGYRFAAESDMGDAAVEVPKAGADAPPPAGSPETPVDGRGGATALRETAGARS